MRFQLATVVALSLANVEALRPRSAAVGALYRGESLSSVASLSPRHGPDGDDEDGMPTPKPAGGAGGKATPPPPPSNPMAGMNMPPPSRRFAHGPDSDRSDSDEAAPSAMRRRHGPQAHADGEDDDPQAMSKRHGPKGHADGEEDSTTGAGVGQGSTTPPPPPPSSPNSMAGMPGMPPAPPSRRSAHAHGPESDHSDSDEAPTAMSKRHGPEGDDEDEMPKPKPKPAGGAGGGGGSTTPPPPPSPGSMASMPGMPPAPPSRRSAHGPDSDLSDSDEAPTTMSKRHGPKGHADGEEDSTTGAGVGEGSTTPPPPPSSDSMASMPGMPPAPPSRRSAHGPDTDLSDSDETSPAAMSKRHGPEGHAEGEEEPTTGAGVGEGSTKPATDGPAPVKMRQVRRSVEPFGDDSPTVADPPSKAVAGSAKPTGSMAGGHSHGGSRLVKRAFSS